MSPFYHPSQTGATFASAILKVPQMRNSDALMEPGGSRRTSRKKDNGLFDPNKPVLLHENIVDGDAATAEVLMEVGFALCDADVDTWFHPYSQFQCRSQGEECCRWKRDTILRCSVTTDITRKDDTLGWVTDLDPLGSLHHPPCLNDGCRLNLKPQHIMRMEEKQLVSRMLSDPEKDALLSRKRDKWFGQFQDEYPMRVGVMPFSRDPSEGPIKKRKLRQSSKAKTSMAAQSHTPDAGPSRPRSDPVSEHFGKEPHGGQFYDAADVRHGDDIKPSLEPEHHLPRPASPSLPRDSRSADKEVNNDIGGYPGITRITDHYLISAQEFDRMQAEKTALQIRVAKLEREADEEERAVLRKENAHLKKQRDDFMEEARATKKEVEELKSKALQLFG